MIAANAWMNTPAGFTLGSDGRVEEVEIVDVLFNTSTFHEFVHMWVAAYLVAGFLVASVYAVKLLRGERSHYNRLGLLIPFTVAAIFSPDPDDRRRLRRPRRLRGPAGQVRRDGMYETGPDQTEYIGGICTDGEVKGAIGIPGLDSLLAGFSTDTVVEGLNDVPRISSRRRRPDPSLLRRDGRDQPARAARGLVRDLLVAQAGHPRESLVPADRGRVGVLSVLALEAGWIVTEVGRQPWIVSGYMKVEEAVTDAQGIWWVFAATMLIYLSLAVITGYVLRGLSERPDEEAPAGDIPYAPRPGEGEPNEQGRRRRGDSLDRGDALRRFGGADFGGGMWDLLAGQSERGERARWLIDRSIAPVWEANHVWLIFVLVVLWTAFPTVFSAIMTTSLHPPRPGARDRPPGAGFAFRHAPRPVRRPATRVFGISSVLTPFFLGTVVGARRLRRGPCRRRWRSDRELDGHPAAAHRGDVRRPRGLRRGGFLVHDAGAAGDEDLQGYFLRPRLRDGGDRRGRGGGRDLRPQRARRYVYDGLTSWPGIVLVIGSGICGWSRSCCSSRDDS